MTGIYNSLSPRFCSRLTRFAVASSALLLTLSALPTSAAQIVFSNGSEDISQLAVGDDLLILVESETLPFALPLPLRASLLDEANQVVAETSWTQDPLEEADNHLLWFRSGVVGCDPGASPNPQGYSFLDFTEAEAYLPGRVFTVELRGSMGIILATRDLPLVMPTAARYFFSDPTGCPRSLLSPFEDLYLSALRADPGIHDTFIFLVATFDQISQAGEIQEVRPHYQTTPQSLTSSLSTGDWTTLLWSGLGTAPGSYGAIVRISDRPTDYFQQKDDLGIGALGSSTTDDGKDLNGITIQDLTCPDPRVCDD